MIQELLYTSHEGRGLRQGGGGGFCTVLSTEGMASNLAAALEKLSGYKHPFDIHDPRSRQNPVNWRHAIIRVGGVAYHVLSRIADLKGEHTGRSNKLAHHVVLGPGDEVPGGPTRLLMHPGFSRTSWNGKVELVHAVPKSSIPGDDLAPRICDHWRVAAGDAGLAGYIADRLLSSPNPAVSVIFPLGTDALALADDVFSLLPAERRWTTTFSTYYAAAPPISSCHLRFVLDGTADAELLRRDHRQVTVDLANPPGLLTATPLVSAARSGVRSGGEEMIPRPRTGAAKSDLSSADDCIGTVDLPQLEPLVVAADAALLPSISRRVNDGGRFPSSTPGLYRANHRIGRKSKSTRKWIIGVSSATVVVGVCALAYLLTAVTRLEQTSDQVVEASESKEQAKTANSSSRKKSVSLSPLPGPANEAPAPQSPSDEPKAPDEPNLKSKNDVPIDTSAKDQGIPESTNHAPKNEVPPQSQSTPPVPSPDRTPLKGPRLPSLKSTRSPEYTPPNQSVVGKDIIKGNIKECSLVGLDWVSAKWAANAKSKESLDWHELGSDLTGWEIVASSTSLEGPKQICAFKLHEEKLSFTWSDAAFSKVKGQSEKAAVLNGLRWCVLKVTTVGGQILYYGLSDPIPPVECNLFSFDQPQKLIETALPVFEAQSESDHAELMLAASSQSSPPIEAIQSLDGAMLLKCNSRANTEDWIEMKLNIKPADDATSELATSHNLKCLFMVDDPLTDDDRRDENAPRIKPVRREFTKPEEFMKSLEEIKRLALRREETLKYLQNTSGSPNLSQKVLEKRARQSKQLEPDVAQLNQRCSDLDSFKQQHDDLIKTNLRATLALDVTYTDGTRKIVVPILAADVAPQENTAVGP